MKDLRYQSNRALIMLEFIDTHVNPRRCGWLELSEAIEDLRKILLKMAGSNVGESDIQSPPTLETRT